MTRYKMLFIDDLDFLSNFYCSSFTWEGRTWPTVEHAFQAAKSLKVRDKLIILAASTPGFAKKLGRGLKLREDWEKIKLDIMVELVLEKFYQNTEIRNKLLKTEDLELIEGNYWHDNTWGDCCCYKCSDIPGVNALGIILMTVRDIFRK